MRGAVGEGFEHKDRSEAGALRPPIGRWIAAGVILLLALSTPAFAVDELQFFRIGTAATTGTYFQIGGVLASSITKPPGSRDCEHGGSCGVPGLVAIAQASQGSIQNVLSIGAGQLESALAQSDIAYWAYTGDLAAPHRCGKKKDENAAPGNGLNLLKSRSPIKNLRAIASLYPEDIHVVVRAESHIRSLHDLKGKRVALGEPESGTLADARLLLEAAGLSECDVKPVYSRLSEAADGLAEGQIDAFFLVGGYPVPAITDVAATVPTRLLPIPRVIAERLTHRFSFLGADVIPGGTYPGMDDDVQTLSTRALWIVRADIDDRLVYAITKALWSEATRRLLDATHPAGKRITLASAFDGVAIPFHPGALQFYREAGLRLPETP